jgi:hypothetical protein
MSELYIVDMRWLSKSFIQQVTSNIVPKEYYSEQTPSVLWEYWLSTVDFVWCDTIFEICSFVCKDTVTFTDRLNRSIAYNRHCTIPMDIEPEQHHAHKQLYEQTAIRLHEYLKGIIPIDDPLYLVEFNHHYAVFSN